MKRVANQALPISRPFSILNKHAKPIVTSKCMILSSLLPTAGWRVALSIRSQSGPFTRLFRHVQKLDESTGQESVHSVQYPGIRMPSRGPE